MPNPDVVVASADPSGLAAALDCARVGLSVTVVELVQRDLPADFSHRDGVIESLCVDWKIPVEVTSPEPGDESLVGIPANPFSPTVRRRLGQRGAWRVYADRVMPLVRIGNETSLERLVTRRLGKRAWRELIAPSVRATTADAVSAETVDVNDLVPGLVEAMSRVGSLTLGVVELMAADSRSVQRICITAGTEALSAELRRQLDLYAATVLALDNKKALTAWSRATLAFAPSESPAGLPDRSDVIPVGIAARRPTLDLALADALRSVRAARQPLVLAGPGSR